MLAGAIKRAIQSIREYTSGISFSGTVSNVPGKVRTVTAILSHAGALTRSLLLAIRNYSGALSSSGTISRSIEAIRNYSSSLSFSGAISTGVSQRFLTRSISGAMSFFGNLYRGWLIGKISHLSSFLRTYTGGVSFSGALSYLEATVNAKTITSALSFVGTIASDLLKSGVYGGTISASGIVSNAYELLRTYAGELNFAGAYSHLATLFGRTYSGAVSFAGSAYKNLPRTYTSALTFAGAVSRAPILSLRTYAGALSFAGSALRASILSRLKSGALSFSGVVSGVLDDVYYWVGKTGDLNFSGAISVGTGRIIDTLSASLEIYGRITTIDIVLDRITAATITPAGTALRNLVTARSTISSGISFSGAMSRIFTRDKTKSGTLTLAGAISGVTSGLWHYTASGALSFAATVSNAYDLLRTYTGTLNFAGNYIRSLVQAARHDTGALSFAGSAIGLFFDADWKSGVLSFTSALSRRVFPLERACDSGLSFGGTISRYSVVNRASAGALSFSAIFKKEKEKLYLGPPNP